MTTDKLYVAARKQVSKKRKEKTAPFGVNLMRSQALYRAAQEAGVTLTAADWVVSCAACCNDAWVVTRKKE